MRRSRRLTPRGLLSADRYVASVDLIDVGWLLDEGVRCVLLDRDNTCVPRDSWVTPPAILEWLDRVHAAGISTCLVSNNFHGSDVERSARSLGSDAVHHAMKPLPFAVWAALRREGATPEEAVLVGDQLYTDMAAGNLAGVRTILVRPQSTRDLWYTLILRRFERLVLGDRHFEGEGRPDRR